MSARRLLALLVVVVLGLLLANPAALSRTGTPHSRAVPWHENAGNPNDGDPDDDDPNGLVDGDDDNWDRPLGHGHYTAASFGAEGGAETGAVTDTSEDQLVRTEVEPGFTLVAMLRVWISCFCLR
jgi:hypothetical protein